MKEGVVLELGPGVCYLYGSYHEIPQKACGGGFFHVMAFVFLFGMPSIRCFEIFKMPDFLIFKIKWGIWGILSFSNYKQWGLSRKLT